MLKKNKGKCILSSVIILLPMLVGLLFWNKLPAYMPIHWGIDGTADSIGSKAFAVCGFPAILLAVHWLGMFITAKDPKSAEQTAKAMGMIYWIVPVISLVVNGFMYAAALEAGMDLMMLMPLLLGVMFVVVGNYLPKCKQNHTLGLKLRWTLGNEENWNATHRFGGRVWVAGGFVFLVSAFLPQTVRILVMTVMFIPMVLLPVVYSWRYAGRQIADGRASAEDFRLASRKAEGKTYIALWI